MFLTEIVTVSLSFGVIHITHFIYLAASSWIAIWLWCFGNWYSFYRDSHGNCFHYKCPHHHFTVSLTQTLARDTPPGVLTVHALSLSHPNIIPPLNKNMVFCGALLTVNHKDPIINLIQSDAIDNNLPEPAFLLVWLPIIHLYYHNILRVMLENFACHMNQMPSSWRPQGAVMNC